MAEGLQVFFGDESEKVGKAQIDESYANFHLRKSGVIKPNEWALAMNREAYGFRYKTRYVDIDIASFVEPIIVVRPLGNQTTAVAVSHVQKEDGSKYFSLYTWETTAPNNNVEYYIFDNWTPPTENFGLELRDSNGKTVYHSSWYRMRVVGSYVSTVNPEVGGSYDVSIPESARGLKKLAMMTANPRIAMLENRKFGENYAQILRDAVYFKNSTTATVCMIPFNADSGWWSPKTEFWNSAPLMILFIDVSDYPTNYG